MTKNKITAVLGPTNTGKTHLAIETMLSFESGMIGFPLRLLAREVYDKVIMITLSYTSLASNLSGNPIMPLSKESMVSIARWVLPVFVGPRTAVILFLVISIFCASFFLPTRYCYC